MPPPDKDFAKRIMQHKPYMNWIAMKLCKDINKADDLVLEVIKKAYKGRHTYQEDEKFKYWLRAIIRNTFINGLRNKETKKKQVPIDDFFSIGFKENFDDRIFLDNVLCFVKKERYGHILLDWISGLSYKKLSKKYNIPMGTVKHRIFATRQNIIQEFKQEYQT